MLNPFNIVVIDSSGPRPQSTRERLQDLSGRKMDHKLWAIVDHIREMAVATGEYGDPEVYAIFKKLEAARLACEQAEWFRKMAHEAMSRAVIR